MIYFMQKCIHIRTKHTHTQNTFLNDTNTNVYTIYLIYIYVVYSHAEQTFYLPLSSFDRDESYIFCCPVSYVFPVFLIIQMQSRSVSYFTFFFFILNARFSFSQGASRIRRRVQYGNPYSIDGNGPIVCPHWESPSRTKPLLGTTLQPQQSTNHTHIHTHHMEKEARVFIFFAFAFKIY